MEAEVHTQNDQEVTIVDHQLQNAQAAIIQAAAIQAQSKASFCVPQTIF